MGRRLLQRRGAIPTTTFSSLDFNLCPIFFLSFDKVFAAYVKAEGGCLFATYVQAEGGCCKGETTPAAPLPHSTQFSRGENRGGSQSPASEPAVHTPVPDNFHTPVPDKCFWLPSAEKGICEEN